MAGLLVCSIHSRLLSGSILDRGVARRSFGLLRRDLWLQIDPSESTPSAGYILRHGPLITSFRFRRAVPEEPRGYVPIVSLFTPLSAVPMLPQHPPAPQSPRRIGVGIDTSRYGHYVVFLRDDLQPAADEMAFAKSAEGYALLQQRLQGIVARCQAVAFVVRLDVTGPYADNLLHFLHRLATSSTDNPDAAEPLALTISCGDPQRNKNYRAAFFGPHKSDPVMAALNAIRFNPAVRALYARVVAKHPQHKAVAVGYAMRKLLHLVFAICKSGRPFDRDHYPWQTPAHVATTDNDVSTDAPISDNDVSVESQAAGHKPDAVPAAKVVTAACADNVGEAAAVGESNAVDFAHVKKQLSLAQVLDHLGLLARLRGSGPQRRGPCPLHRGDGRGRTFSVNLEAHVFQCFDKGCGQKGDAIDLWSALHGLPLREAALDLVRTFGLEACPRHGTEKRNG